MHSVNKEQTEITFRLTSAAQFTLTAVHAAYMLLKYEHNDLYYFSSKAESLDIINMINMSVYILI